MNTSALEEVLQNILSYNLTIKEKQWLANRLCADDLSQKESSKSYEIEEETTTMLKEEDILSPYTKEEIDARLDEAEREFEAGGGIDNEEVFREALDRMCKVQYA